MCARAVSPHGVHPPVCARPVHPPCPHHASLTQALHALQKANCVRGELCAATRPQPLHALPKENCVQAHGHSLCTHFQRQTVCGHTATASARTSKGKLCARQTVCKGCVPPWCTPRPVYTGLCTQAVQAQACVHRPVYPGCAGPETRPIEGSMFMRACWGVGTPTPTPSAMVARSEAGRGVGGLGDSKEQGDRQWPHTHAAKIACMARHGARMPCMATQGARMGCMATRRVKNGLHNECTYDKKRYIAILSNYPH